MPKTTAVAPLNLGLYYSASPLSVPVRGLQDGRNFRIRNGRISNTNLGWGPWSRSLGTKSNNTLFLLHFEGADASTKMLDTGAPYEPPYRFWTANGNAQLDTAQSKFGVSSLLLDGAGDYISLADSDDWNLLNFDFTIDLWFFCNAAGGSLERIAGHSGNAGTAAVSGWDLFRNAGNTITARVSNGSSFFSISSTSQFTNAVNAGWNHLAFVRTNNVLKLFLNGVQEGGDLAFTGSVNNPAEAVAIGTNSSGVGTDTWTGWIDEFRLTFNEALWTTDFSVPIGPASEALNGPVMLIETFVSRGNPEVTVVATNRDLYAYDDDSDTFRFITPQYNTATVDVSAANPAVVTPDTGTPNWVTNGIKAGDKIFFGSTLEQNPEAEWYEIDTVDGEGQLTLTTTVQGAALNNVAYTIRRQFSGAIADTWDTDTFVQPNDGVEEDMIFFTNGVDDVVTWIFPDDVAIYQTSLGFTCKQLRVFKSMMLYANLELGGDLMPTTFINSDVGIPLDTSGGLAGQFRVHDGVDQIHEMEDLGDNMVFYSERHLTLMQFVGDPLIFIFRQASTGIGPLGPRLVADFGDYHEFVGADSQYLFDGVSVTEVGIQAWREILRSRDASRQTLGFIHFDEENGDLIWAIPLASDVEVGDTDAPPEEAFVEHYLEIESEQIPDPVSRRDMPFVCGGYATTTDVIRWSDLFGTWENSTIKWNDSTTSAAFPINLMGTEDGYIMVINVAQNGNGVALPSYISLGRRPLGDSKERGLLRRVYPFASKLVGNLQVISKYSDHASGPVTTQEENLMDLDLPQEGHFVTPYRRGRFFELEFRRDDGDAWELEGYDTDIIRGGYR